MFSRNHVLHNKIQTNTTAAYNEQNQEKENAGFRPARLFTAL